MIKWKFTKPWDIEETEKWIADYFSSGYRLVRIVGGFYQYTKDEKAKNKRCYMSVYVQGHDSIPGEWRLKSFYWPKSISVYVFRIIKNSKDNFALCNSIQKRRYELIRIRMGYKAFVSLFLATWCISHFFRFRAEMGIILVMLPLSIALMIYFCFCLYSIVRLTMVIQKKQR